MATKKYFVVTSKTGLNLREQPSKKANILKILDCDEKIEADWSVEAPAGWIPVKDGGFVMREFVK